MPASDGEDEIKYDADFWKDRLGQNADTFTETEKMHLIYSLFVFLQLSLASFLEFYFSSTLVDVKRRAASFMAYRSRAANEEMRFAPGRIFRLWHDSFPTARPHLHAMIEECAREIVLEESNRIIEDPALQIRTSTLTVQGIRDLLRPSAIAKKLQDHAPLMWSLCTVFSSAPNRYRRKNVQDVEEDEPMYGSSSGSASDASEDPASEDDENEKMPAGFSRNPRYAVIVVISMLAFVRNRATNVLPLLLGLFLKVNGTSSRVLQLLSNIGLSVSESTIERLKEVISVDAIRQAVECITSSQMFYIVFDNINIYLKKFQQRLTNRNSMIHATNAAVVAIDEEGVDKEAALDMKSFLELRGGRSKARFEDIVPTKEDGEHMQQAYAGLIARMLIRYCPGSDKWENRKEMLAEAEKMIPQDRPLTPKKTAAYPFGVFDVNEGSKHGLVRVLEKIRERTTVPVMEWVKKVRIFCGDWLTSANFRGARRDRSDDVDAMERLEYGFPLSTLWHYGLQATHMIMRVHLGHSVVEDPTCLRAHKGLLNRTWDVNKPNYAAAKALIRHSLIARLLNIVMVFRKLKTWKGLSQWRPDFSEIKEISLRIVREYATTAAAEAAKKKGDDWLAHSIYFIRDALIFFEFEDAVAHADAGRVLRVLRFWCFSFRGAGQHNYARECAEVLLQWKYETTAELRKVLERSWFINRWGLAGRWIAADLYVEQLNFWIKRVLIAHGNGVTIEYIQKKGSACIEAFREVTHLVANFFGDKDRSRRSKEVAFQKDLEALVDEMVNKKVHQISTKPRIVYAPPPKPRANANPAKSNPTPRKSAIVDCQVIGAEVWQAGKFSEFLRATAYDTALKSYPLTGASDTQTTLPESGTVFDNSENPLATDMYEDLHGDDMGSGGLGGGDEFWTGNPDGAE